MCVVIAKYFDNVGWVGVKNRDRNYVPDLSFRKKKNKNTEVLYFWDDITQYCEGMNDSGICVLSASLMVLDDEKEITVRSRTPSKDGAKIQKALKLTDLKAVCMSLIKQKLPGNTIIFNQQECYLLEAAWAPGGYSDKDYRYKIKKQDPGDIVARTNHGVWLKWAGYQYGAEKNESASAISSRSRLRIAEHVAQVAETPAQLIDLLTRQYTDNHQLNAMRLADDKKMMRTTAQLLLVPREGTMFVRPVQSNITFNFWKLNEPGSKLWVELLSNRVLRSQGTEIINPISVDLNHNSD
jgi:hypothetical protein